MKASLDELLARAGVDVDRCVFDRGAFASDYESIPLKDASVTIHGGAGCDGISVWQPVGMAPAPNISLAVGTRPAENPTEIFLFARPAGKVHMNVQGDGHRVSILSALNFTATIQLFRASTVTIGQGATSGGVFLIAGNSDIVIGKDALMSDQIVLQSTDQHGVIDAETLEPLNAARSHITIDRHAWIGRRVMVTKNVTVAGGAILAAGAVVVKNVPAMAAVGGNPATVLKSGICWTRQAGSLSALDRRMIDEIKAGLKHPVEAVAV
ncbi:MAG: hypothetical protein EP335_18385 [Alphaproteobacteria bacterium]|nr:MAG: hypothetical protein EP335_18385 [Alphaproteobacteria bacterium]